MRFILLLVSFILASSSFAAQPKEWTFLLFLNGKNNLDKYGHMNLNQIEKIGSTDKINIIVQWGSLKNGTVQRLYMQKDNDTNKVTSMVLEDLGNNDMGSWKSLVDFIQWGAKNFPAQHYFVDVWDHGSGWHSLEDDVIFKDISNDDVTGNHMTTKELAAALYEGGKAIGHKIDIYGSDACLMGMLEVAAEVAPAVSVYVGSEDLEPGAGWPYDAFFARWNQTPNASAKDIARILTEEYARSYSFAKSNSVTLSSFDLNALPDLELSIQQFGSQLKALGAADLNQIQTIARESQSFFNADYVDLIDFVNNVKKSKFSRINPVIFQNIEMSTKAFLNSNGTVGYPRAHGMTMWIPAKRRVFKKFEDLYTQLQFDQRTHWSEVAKLISR